MFTIHHLDTVQGKIILQLNTKEDGTPLEAPVHMQVSIPIVNGMYVVGQELTHHLTTEFFTPMWNRIQEASTVTNQDDLIDFVAEHTADPTPLPPPL